MGRGRLASSLAHLTIWVLSISGCANDPSVAPSRTTDVGTRTVADEEAVGAQPFPDVVGATAAQDDDGSWTISATISSPYDSPDRYADAWRVLGPDGTEFGIRELLHDHANEQPFTRSQSGIAVPDEVRVVTIEARDLENGWGGGTFRLDLRSDAGD